MNAGPAILGTVGSRGCRGQSPVIRDEEHVMSHQCHSPQGGTRTVGAPEYVLSVENVPDEVCDPDPEPAG